MKYILSVIAFLVVLIMSTKSFALDTDVKGFIALDLATIEQIQHKRTAIESGIGVLDLKIYANHENMSAKFKLDLDDSSIGEAYNIFEEATATYKFNSSFKATAGKGVVPFHKLHWGAMENSYIDGGTIIGVYPYWVDVDEKIILSMNYRNQDLKFNNSFTFWGDSQQFKRNSQGEFYTTPKTGYAELETTNAKTFRTTDEWGLANKFEFYPIKGWEFSLGGIMYDHDLNPDVNWAVDTGFGYETDKVEVWFETMYGRGSTTHYAKYSTFKKWDNTYQLGAEFYGTDLFNYVVNSEYAIIDDTQWPGNATYKFNTSNLINDRTKTAKLDLALKIKVAKMAHISVGVVGEKQWRKKTYATSVSETTTQAGQAGVKLSFWF